MIEARSGSARYRADIDGLRAVAVLAVLAYHAGLGVRGGYAGVDVFFVISGYLITGLILKDIDRGRFSIVQFWERRARRILPALSVVVLSCLVAGWFLFLPHDFKKLGQSASAQALLMSNAFFWRESGYFTLAAETKPLLHTWSLAVEEQFYLLFPFLLIALRRTSRETIRWTFLLFSILSFGLSVYCSYRYPLGNFYFLPTRIWELLIGALLVASPARRALPRPMAEALGWIGLSGILYASYFYTDATRFPGASAVLPCLGTALVIRSNDCANASLKALLSFRPVVFIGLISYSLYLWHWPVLAFYKYRALGEVEVGTRVALMLLSIVIATFSWRFVETPLRRRLILKTRRRLFVGAVTAVTLTFAMGLAIHELNGMPSRLPPEAQRYANAAMERTFFQDLSLTQAVAGEFAELGNGDRRLPIELLVWGDSHAMAAMPVLDALCREHAVRGVAATHLATAPLAGYESDDVHSLKEASVPFNSAVLDFIRAHHVGRVVLIAKWEHYIDADNGVERLRGGMLNTLNALRDSGTKIWVMKQVPEYRREVPRDLAIAVLGGRKAEEIGLSLAEYRVQATDQNAIFSGLPATHPQFSVLDPGALFLGDTGRCRVALDGKSLYRDADHLSSAGAMLLRPLFEPVFADIRDTSRAK